jgi:hypothetical protein
MSFAFPSHVQWTLLGGNNYILVLKRIPSNAAGILRRRRTWRDIGI